MIHLVYGGSGSGKSAFAEECAVALKTDGLFYIATMQAYDKEAQAKIARHRDQRAGKGFETIEQPRDISDAVRVLESYRSANPGCRISVLIDCLSNLCANEMFSGDFANETSSAEDIFENDQHTDSERDQQSAEIQESKRRVLETPGIVSLVSEKIINELSQVLAICDNAVIVSNNIFDDGFYGSKETQEYMNALGIVNIELARISDKVTEVVAGIPVEVK